MIAPSVSWAFIVRVMLIENLCALKDGVEMEEFDVGFCNSFVRIDTWLLSK